MFNFKLFVAASCVCLFSMAAVSCNKMESPTEATPEEYEVSLALGGEMVDVSYAPLTKAESSTDTLFVVSVLYGESSSCSTKYAHGVFDDFSKCRLKILSGKYYNIKVKAIVGGVEKLHHYKVLNGSDSCYFYTKQGHLTNSLFYYSSNGTDENLYYEVYRGTTYYQDGTNDDRSSLPEFYGECSLSSNSTIDILPIDMYYAGFQVNVKANGLKETDGNIACSWMGWKFNLSYDNPTWSSGTRSFYSLTSMLSAIKGANEYYEFDSFYATYTKTIDGIAYTTKFANGTYIYAYRKKITNITLNVDHNTVSSDDKAVNLTFDTTDFDETTKEYDFSGKINE